MTQNLDEATISSFGEEWSHFDQSELPEQELHRMFSEYFDVFPWSRVSPGSRGADIGCGSGRWARLVAGRVAELHCVDASARALQVARRNLASLGNVAFHHAPVDSLPFEDGSLDFAYSLGVLHHLPDPASGMKDCARILKPGAPLFVYLYYSLDRSPLWYRSLWRISDWLRRRISGLSDAPKALVCDLMAALVYWPLARGAWILGRWRLDVSRLPLNLYANRSFYSMRTDSRDRFGTPVEKRFRPDEIVTMMSEAGLQDIRIAESPPFWRAVGFRAAIRQEPS